MGGKSDPFVATSPVSSCLLPLAFGLVLGEMAGSKRRAFTADDLMRIQEGPLRKRLRLGDADEEELEFEDSVSEDGVEEVDGVDHSQEEDEGSGSDSEEDGEGDEDGSEDEAQRLGDESDVSQNAVPPISITQDEDDETDTRFASSRISFKPRAANPTALQAPLRVKPLPSSFETMGISTVLISTLAKMSIRSPTEIQAACIPPLLAGESFIASTCSGS